MKKRKILISRFPYGFSMFAVLMIAGAAALNYFLFQQGVTVSEPVWKKAVLFSVYGILIIMDLLELIFYPAENQYLHTLFFISRTILIIFMQNMDVTQFSQIMLGMITYHAFLTFGLVVSLMATAVNFYYFMIDVVEFTTPSTIIPIFSLLFFQLVGIFAERDKVATFHNQEIIKDLSSSNIELRTYIEDLSRLSVMEERVQLSNDLHDSLGHYLVAINIQLEKAMAYRSISSETVDEAVLNAKVSVEQALKEVRRFVDGLHDHEDVFSVKEKAEDITKQYKDSYDTFEYKYEGNEFGFAKIIRRNMVYILQELLTNIQKHAEAKNVDVRINFSARDAYLFVKDDGIGMRPLRMADRNGHYGLESIQQRVDLLNGSINIQSNRKNGTTIEIKIPKKQGGLAGKLSI